MAAKINFFSRWFNFFTKDAGLQVFENFPDPVVIIDNQYAIKYVNQALLSSLNKEASSNFIGFPCYEALYGLKQICPHCTAPETFSTGEKTFRIGSFEVKNSLPETNYKIFYFPIFDKKKKVKFTVEYYQNFTELRNLQKQLYASEKARVMEPLSAGLTHQIRQPLTIVRSACQYVLEMFKDQLQSKDFEETMGSILSNTDTLNEIINDLLFFSRPSQFKKASVANMLEQGLRLVRHQIREQETSLVTDFTNDLPEILMDEMLLLQAFLNLLINSLESMDKGGKLTVKSFYQDAPTPPRIFIIIEDTGKGIPQEYHAKITQPFFTTKEKGLGLGLTITEEIIKSHGGKINFESQQNRGTKVTVEIPL